MSSTERRPSDGGDGGRDGRRCPECGTSREPGSAPACGCTERAADAAQDARSADAAAAEDFDPLRIRPYVTLPEPGPATAEPEPGPAPALALPPETVAPPRSADVGLFAAGSASDGAPPPRPYDDALYDDVPYDDESEPRRGRTGLYAGVGAAMAVVAVAVLATLLLAPDRPHRDEALPDAPTRAVDAPSDSATGAASKAPPSRSPSQPSSSSTPDKTTRPPTPSPSSSPSGTASAEQRTTPPPSRSTARATGSVEPAPPTTGGVLSRGDKGPEVKELQQRLQQLYLYMGEPNGMYNAPVADAVARFQYARGTQRDGEGVYGARTRAALEAETTEP
ncbi:peptidoglycan-binding protein [Streptomyces sp. NPDC047197]|uniref:peptidoglycan-binding domain-containing protein n=1 Tax=Streptomyces sp. NPDC047197 TaxID=3155477 RepID=UPI0033C13A3C